MKKVIILVVILLILIGIGIFFIRGRGVSQAQAVLKVNASSPATIFLDNETIGKTPYEEKIKPGEYTIKLIPESTSSISWEGKITLQPNLLTYVNRDLKESELTSAGEVLTLEKISGKDAEISVISTPDRASVTVGDKDYGTTPVVIRDLRPGDYDLTVTIANYAPRTVKIKTTEGYRLSAVFNLATTGVAQASPSPVVEASPDTTPRPSGKVSPSPSGKATPKPSGAKSSPPAKPYVEILDTPTGFLRVRAEASTAAEEVGRVNPGEFYSLLDESGSWFKIEYETNKEGWISAQYAKKTE